MQKPSNLVKRTSVASDTDAQGRASMAQSTSPKSKPRIALADAIVVAELVTDGKTVGIEINEGPTTVTVRVDVAKGDALNRVDIDAQTGNVICIVPFRAR